MIPGGVDGNAKSFAGMPVIKNAYGSRLVGIDGREYIDYCIGYGPLIFGHNDPEMIAALKDSLENGGFIYGLPHLGMWEAASLVCRCVPCAEMVRFTNSGTEATLSCIRLARAITGRDKIVKFYGAYHGTHESVLIGIKASQKEPAYPYVGADSAGLPQGVIQDTLVLPFNELEYSIPFIEKHAGEIAAVLVEPVLGSYGIVAEKAFLEALRQTTAQHGIILVFDEVVTGFRLAPGGIQELFGVIPDLVALGKAMGGGIPIGAFAGRRQLMEHVAPTEDAVYNSHKVAYHSGTYNANPLAMTAVKTAIGKLMRDDPYGRINGYGEAIRQAIQSCMEAHGIEGTTTGMGSLVQCHFGIHGEIRRVEELVGRDLTRQERFQSLLMDRGVFFIPGPRAYVSAVLQESDVDRTLEAIEDVFRIL